jgi:DNA (cytosine-5)-methyltransferase 1
MKILNLYACLGGNRYKWNDVADIEVTAVELDPELARLYQERFPNDNVIIEDAHQYLLDHYKEFDFIWSSPPCPTHSKINISQKNKWKMKYPDMRLYQEVIFLDNWFTGKYVVENVIPYYEPLIPAKKRGRHLYWTNFNLPVIKERDAIIRRWQIPELEKHHEIDLSSYKGLQNKRKIGRNLVDYEAGKTILETALGIINRENVNQTTMF